MKRLIVLASSVVMMVAATVVAKELESGLPKGERLGAFNVIKCAGEEADTVAIGEKLCYRCRNGSRPQVMVFTRSTGKEVTAFTKLLDEHVKKFEDQQLRVFVNVMGESKASAEKMAEKLATDAGTKNIPYVVPVEFENGPADYGINPKAELTVVIGNDNKVVANFAFESVEKLETKDIVASVKEMLK